MEHAPDWMEWTHELDPRERAQIDHARAYAKNHASAGVPGHSQHMLIAKLAELLDTAQIGMYPPVDHSLLKPAALPVFDPTRPPNVSNKPGGFA